MARARGAAAPPATVAARRAGFPSYSAYLAFRRRALKGAAARPGTPEYNTWEAAYRRWSQAYGYLQAEKRAGGRPPTRQEVAREIERARRANSPFLQLFGRLAFRGRGRFKRYDRLSRAVTGPLNRLLIALGLRRADWGTRVGEYPAGQGPRTPYEIPP